MGRLGPWMASTSTSKLSLAASGSGNVDAVVELASYLGPVREHLVRIGTGQRIVVRDTTARAGALLSPGEPVGVRWDDGAERLFDAAGTPMTIDSMAKRG